MDSEMKHYSLQDFDKIIHHGLTYSLPSDVIHKILDLKKALLVVSIATVPTNRRPPVNQGTRTWTKPIVKPFETFKREVVPESGIEKDIQIIRLLFNKISQQSYERLKQNIIDIINEYKDTPENVDKIANIMFITSSQNSFLAELNAKLYKELSELYPAIFSAVMMTNIKLYIQTFTLEGLGRLPEETEDLWNKRNDRRKAMTIFIAHLTHIGAYSIDLFMNTVSYFIEKFDEIIEIAGHSVEVDEIVENLFLAITKGFKYGLISGHSTWDSLYEKIGKYAEFKKGDKPSLCSRSIFKIEELLNYC